MSEITPLSCFKLANDRARKKLTTLHRVVEERIKKRLEGVSSASKMLRSSNE